jgi:cytochrome c oxidase assembly factor CtaG/cytochrome c2
MMLLHASELLAPHDLMSAWSFEPGVILLLGVTLGLHVTGVRRLYAHSVRHRTAIRREAIFFFSGLAVLAIALVSPLHQLGEVLFSAHMIQHELLMAVAAPLLILGRPLTPMVWALPIDARRTVGLAFTHGFAKRAWVSISNPFSAWLLHAVAIWGWHAPRLYDASVQSELVHTAQHLSFTLTALLFWWSVLGPRAQKHGGGAGIISLFTTGLHTTLLGALIATADVPLFSAYTVSGTANWGLTPLSDQQLGGVIMWVPAGIVYLAVALYLFYGWIGESGARISKIEAGRKGHIAARAGHVAVVALLISSIAGCHGMSDAEAGELTGGNPHRGAEAMRRYGCQSCHSIPGISGATALVGPPLGGIASRSFIAGVLVNNPSNMITWLLNPPAVDSKTAMPNMGVTEKDARDMSAYLYTLR